MFMLWWAMVSVCVMENGQPLEGQVRVPRPKLNNDKLTRLSKRLSKLLRHLGGSKPTGQAQMFSRFYNKRDDGWCEVSVVAGQLDTNQETVVYLAKNDSKQRYELMQSDNVMYIRCQQGHCDAWAKLMGADRLKKWMNHVWTELHDYSGICVHGTTREAWDTAIVKCGYLDPMDRFCVHFASSEGDTVVSGMRDASTVRIYIDVKLWHADGHAVWMTNNKVVHLIQGNGERQIGIKYWSRVVDSVTGEELYRAPEAPATVPSPEPWPDPVKFWKDIYKRT